MKIFSLLILLLIEIDLCSCTLDEMPPLYQEIVSHQVMKFLPNILCIIELLQVKQLDRVDYHLIDR